MKQNFFVSPLLKPSEPVQKVFFFWDVEFALPRSRMTNQKRNLLIIILWYKLSKIEGYHKKEHKILHKGRVNPPSLLIFSMNSGPIPLKTHFLLSWNCPKNRSAFELSLVSCHCSMLIPGEEMFTSSLKVTDWVLWCTITHRLLYAYVCRRLWFKHS